MKFSPTKKKQRVRNTDRIMNKSETEMKSKNDFHTETTKEESNVVKGDVVDLKEEEEEKELERGSSEKEKTTGRKRIHLALEKKDWKNSTETTKEERNVVKKCIFYTRSNVKVFERDHRNTFVLVFLFKLLSHVLARMRLLVPIIKKN